MATKNIFAEFGFELEEATAEAWRSDLARIVRECFRRSQTSQIAFANRIGVKQSVISRIINGRISGLSVEFLLRICVRLGTRGIATWGPSADEAKVTTEMPAVLGTALSVSEATLNVAGEAVHVPPRTVTSGASKRAVGSKSRLVQLH